MKDLGEAAYILGIKIYRDRSKRLIGLSQDTYIDKVLKRFNMEEAKKGFLPMSHGIHLSKTQCPTTTDERERMSKVPYASAIGSIMYAVISTRPDVSYALSVTSRYQSDPGESHWTAVKNILKYLRITKNVFFVYGGEEELIVTGYTDASFQTNKDDSKSQSGYVFTINGGVVSWKSYKQETVADFTTEAEYIAASEATKEGVWIRKFLIELGCVSDRGGPVKALTKRITHEGARRGVVTADAGVDVPNQLLALGNGNASLQDARGTTLVQLVVDQDETLGPPRNAPRLSVVRG